MSEFADRARALHQSIRDILMDEWDPIGVAGIPAARDEYDAYIPTIYSFLVRRKDANEIYGYLVWAEAENMQLAVDRQKTHRVAEKLVSLVE